MDKEPPPIDLRSEPLPDTRGLEDSLSPVAPAIEREPLPHPLAWTSKAIAVATLFLFLFNAAALRDWAYQLRPGPIATPITALAERWYAAVDPLGFNAPVRTLHNVWLRLSEEEGAPQPGKEDPPAAQR